MQKLSTNWLCPQESEWVVEVDDRKRKARGAVCSLLESENGRHRDVKNEGGAKQVPWRYHVIFTFKDFDSDEIENFQLSEK